MVEVVSLAVKVTFTVDPVAKLPPSFEKIKSGAMVGHLLAGSPFNQAPS